MEKLLTIREVADHLGIATGTAYHWLSTGRLPCVRLSSRCVRFRESDVEKMLEQLRSSDANEKTDLRRNRRRL